ncbi:ATP-binding protein [Domibacillus epiphyticus]|uniref:histidine kinase n=1 Tax=Domibacillus epiphyticus TaxID=1714355 RepID=A0A1V2A4Y9_9BACI|nr:sensor histidine kinase [Domibacillus epiphyticus]OMP66026.1 histidine kinase [Domibacillus epiphyticus]
MVRVPIQWKITGLIVFILMFSFFVLGIVLTGNYLETEESELRDTAILTARTVAELPGLAESLSSSNRVPDGAADAVEELRVINKADYIVVLNMDRVRLTHPVQSKIGTVSNGKDEGPAFAEHSYTAKGEGEVGTVIRSFVPILDEAHNQVGVVIAGYKLPQVMETVLSVKMEIVVSSILALLISCLGAYLLARHLKEQMFKLEPHEIAQLVVERTETFNAMHEGVIAIDKFERITIFNDRAKAMLGVKGDVIGHQIREVLPDTQLPEVLQLDHPIYNKNMQIRNLAILSNRVPIRVAGSTVGAIAIFQDRTQVKQLAEELTGVKAFVSALRVQNHEHMNKLHTIAGLIQLGNREKALEYVFQVSEEQEELTRFLSKNIKDDSLSGLLLSKVSRGKELGIQVIIDRHSKLQTFPLYLDHHDFVLVLGNLIENAFDSFQKQSEDNQIYVSIQQTEQVLSILVEDNGPGIEKEKQPFIFNQGFSTKAKTGRGIGLYLVKQIVEKGSGEIQLESIPGEGTTFILTFPMNHNKNRGGQVD